MFDTQIQVGKKTLLASFCLQVSNTSAAARQPARQCRRSTSIIQIRRRRRREVPPCFEEMKCDLALNAEGSSLSPQMQLHHRLTLSVYTPPSLPGIRGGNTCSDSNSIYINMFLKDSPPRS